MQLSDANRPKNDSIMLTHNIYLYRGVEFEIVEFEDNFTWLIPTLHKIDIELTKEEAIKGAEKAIDQCMN